MRPMVVFTLPLPLGGSGLYEGARPTQWDIIGSLVAVLGMVIIMLGPRQ